MIRVSFAVAFAVSLAACTQSSTTTAVAEAPPARGCGPAAACEGAPAAPSADTAALTSVAPEHEGGCGMHGHEDAAAPDSTVTAAFTAPPAPGAKAKCLVMDREFVVEQNTPTSTYQGKTYAFCCDGCKELFDKDPAKYAALADQNEPHG